MSTLGDIPDAHRRLLASGAEDAAKVREAVITALVPVNSSTEGGETGDA